MYSRIVRYSTERDHLVDLRPRRLKTCVDRCPRHRRVRAGRERYCERTAAAAQQEDSRAIARNGASMISSEVQRTLVKSPPELWAEISDPEALARHLGEFGEIRITRVQPEQKVEWEAPEASGSIVIKPSGWGTKVKLTVTRELGEAAGGIEPGQASDDEQPAVGAKAEEAVDAGLQPDSADESEPADVLEPAGAEVLAEEQPPGELADGRPAEEQPEQAEDEITASSPLEADDDELEDEPIGTSGPSIQNEPAAKPARRRGFFARLFGRRREAWAAVEEPDLHTSTIADELEEAAGQPEPSLVADQAAASDHAMTLAAEVAIVEQELDAEPAPAPEPPRTPAPIAPATPAAAASASESIGLAERDGAIEHAPSSDAPTDIAAELERAEEAAQEQVTAVLTGVLDRLGAAHHRPFSRA
jgi:hypothetical protein